MTCPKYSLNTKNLFTQLNQNLCAPITIILCKEILINTPIGSKRSKIHLIMTGKEGEDTWPSFNKYFALFADAQQTCANITTGHIC